MKRRMSILAPVLIMFLITVTLGAAPVAAQTAPPPDRVEPRLVTVTGEAVVEVVPDEVVLTLGVESADKQLRLARSLNDGAVLAGDRRGAEARHRGEGHPDRSH